MKKIFQDDTKPNGTLEIESGVLASRLWITARWDRRPKDEVICMFERAVGLQIADAIIEACGGRENLAPPTSEYCFDTITIGGVQTFHVYQLVTTTDVQKDQVATVYSERAARILVDALNAEASASK